MTRINVGNIRHPDASADSIQLSSAGRVTLDGIAYPSAGPLSNRNLIINGAMQVAQRGTQTTGLTGNANGYPADRFRFFVGSLGTWTIDQSTDAPPGFSNSAKMTCTTGKASPDAGNYIFLEYSAEAQDLQQLDFGASTAKATKLSFYVKSNKTGTGSVEIQQLDNSNEQFVGTYAISSADTWELKTIDIPADTDGVINNDNGTGLRFRFWLNSGTNSSGGSTTTAWTTYVEANSNISNLGVGGATSDNWAITGVQLEVGSVATPFEHRSYGDELARCRRYYQRFTDASSDKAICPGLMYTSTVCVGVLQSQVQMRAVPTIESASGTDYFGILRNGDSDRFNSVSISSTCSNECFTFLNASGTVSGTAGHAGWMMLYNAAAYIGFSSEL